MTTTIKERFKAAAGAVLLSATILLWSASASAQIFDYSIVHSFGAPRMGTFPKAPLLLGNEGQLYGTTQSGGDFGYGVVYEIDALGAERPIYSFTGGTDGGIPKAGLINDPAGNLYGTTVSGGDLSCNPPSGCGTVFKLDSSYELSVLHTFTKNEGFGNFSALVRDESGNLYGSLSTGISGFGAIFKLDPLGNLTVLHNFSGLDGTTPNGLIIDALGNLYGTTNRGGAHGMGTVFKLDQAGHISIFHAFAGGYDGDGPIGALARDSAGNVYGATLFGGTSCLCGTVFKVNLPSRTETVLHHFVVVDGQEPDGDLILDSGGNLYGTTSFGGLGDWGTIFMLDGNSVFSKLYDFTYPGAGIPAFGAGLIMDRAGNLFGTTLEGPNGAGSVYKLTRQ